MMSCGVILYDCMCFSRYWQRISSQVRGNKLTGRKKKKNVLEGNSPPRWFKEKFPLNVDPQTTHMSVLDILVC